MPKQTFVEFLKPPKEVKNAEAKAKRFVKLAERIEDIRIGMKLVEMKEERKESTRTKTLFDKQMRKFAQVQDEQEKIQTVAGMSARNMFSR